VKHPAVLVCLSLVTEALASELDIVLTEKEQQLVTIAEQQRQAQNMIDMIEALEKLIDYPDAAIEELTSNSASHQSLKRVIRALKDDKQKKLEEAKEKKLQEDMAKKRKEANSNNQPVSTPSVKAGDFKKDVRTVQLKPIFARAERTNSSAQNKVIFHSDKAGAISVYEGQSFKYDGKSYQLLGVEPTKNSGNSEFKSSEFKISLKTPDEIKQYVWPAG
jgi:cell wall-associated NlpC family hydrolase